MGIDTTARTITALTVQKRNPNRVNVSLDGEFAFGLARIVAAWLTLGQVLTPEKIAALQAQDAEEVAYAHAIKLLNYRPRTTQELRRKLLERQTAPELIETVLTRLQQSGLLNDSQFAQAWVENRGEFRPRSKRALAYELRQKGLTDEHIETTLAEVDDEPLAEAAARKAVRRLSRLEWPDFRQKLLAHLARRGFSYAVCAPVVARLWDELHSDSSLDNHSPSDEVDYE